MTAVCKIIIVFEVMIFVFFFLRGLEWTSFSLKVLFVVIVLK